MTDADSQKGDRVSVVEAVAGAFGLLAGIVVLIYVFGGIVLLLRLQVRGLRAEVVVATLPREFLVSVGLAVLFQFVLFVAVLLAASIPQKDAVVSKRLAVFVANHDRLGRWLGQTPSTREAIRAIIVFFATIVLAVPLARWIGWGDSGWGVVAAAIFLPIALGVIFFLRHRRSPKETSEATRRWQIGVFMFVLAIVSLAIGAVSGWRQLWLLAVLWAAALTALLLWFLLRWLYGGGQPEAAVPLPPEATDDGRSLLVRTGFLILFAFLIFVPWRVALELASIPGLDVAVCTKDEERFGGLFIGENDNSVYVGEGEWAVVEADSGRVLSAGLTQGEAEEALQAHDDDPATQGPLETQSRSPRIAEIPRTEIRRVFLGKRAREVDCASN